jgi:uncharacterized iron-regulated membrane protein
MLWIHRYLGLLAAIPLLLLGLSGALIEFEVEIDHALNRGYWDVQPREVRLSWGDVIAGVHKAYPADPVTSLHFPSSQDTAAEVSLKSGLAVAVDPYTGQTQGTRRRGWSVTTYIHQFHTHLLMGEVGGKIVSIATLVLIVLTITGLVLWWRRKRWWVGWAGSWRKFNYEAHEAMGIAALLPLLILAITGVAIGFEGVVRPMLYKATNSQPSAMPAVKSGPAHGAKPLTVNAAISQLQSTLPGAEIVFLQIPTSPGGAFTAFMRFPEDRTPGGRSRVALDQFSGKPLWIENSRTTALGTQIFNKNRPIHTGDIFGWPTRIIAAVASLILVMQVFSGAWIWLARKIATPARPRAGSRRPQQSGVPS